MHRAVFITPDYTVLGPTARDVASTPADYAQGGPDALAARVGRLFDDEGVILLDEAAAAALGGLGGQTWVTVNGAPRVYIGVESALRGHSLADDMFPLGLVGAFQMFHDLVGVAYHRSPGVAGLSLMMALHPKGRTKPIVWESEQPADAHESQYFLDDWSRDLDPGTTCLHGYDKRRAGLAAMQTVEVARYALRHTGRKTFDPSLGGWWLCEVPTWNDPRMPDPAGYGDTIPHRREVRWLTTPTVQLLNDLADEGVSAGVRYIHDSWTAPKSRLFSRWTDRIQQAYQKADSIARSGDRGPWAGADQAAEHVREAVKEVYRETAGMFTAATSWVRRHDWYAAIVAMNRANMWRAAWVVGKRTGIWPVRVDGDKWWYPSHDLDGVAAAATLSWDESGRRRGIVLGDSLGQWRHQGSKEISSVG